MTAYVLGSGTYQLRPVYTKGWNGLDTVRVALAAAPRDEPQKLTEVAVDQHTSFSGAEPKNDLFTLKLPTYDPGLRYFILADIRGTKSSDKLPERRGCNGVVNFWKVRQPGEALPDLPLLPMSEAETARFGATKFRGTGLRVGVVPGYGAEGMIGCLKAQADLDVQPVYALNPENLRGCQVLIVPQPRLAEAVTPEIAALLGRFVEEGGGLMTTHDAVGHRACPVLLPRICRRGAAQMRIEGWEVAADHPALKDLPRDRRLTESYYDFIALEPGPDGTVIARGCSGAPPAIIAGQAGKGRYLACGLGLCIAAADDADVPPTPDEAALLVGAVHWLGGKR